MNTMLISIFSAFAFLPVLQATGQQKEGLVTVHPEETEEVFANPGTGWETFHRTSKADKSLPAWFPSTVEYIRWGWGELEPQSGKLNTEFLDKVLQQATTRDSSWTTRIGTNRSR
jgi:hypothetical protein